MVQLKLRRFDMSSINDDSIVVMLGKRRTGKSYLVKDLLWYHQDLPVGTVVSPTECVNEFYSSIVPSLFIHDAVTPELLASFVRRQRLITKRMTRDIARMGASKIDPRAFLLLDDCLYDKTWANNEQIRFLFMNGRHIKSLVLITMQYPLGIPPNLRTNIDYTFILRENNVSIQKRIFDNYAGMFPNFPVAFWIVGMNHHQPHTVIAFGGKWLLGDLPEEVLTVGSAYPSHVAYGPFRSSSTRNHRWLLSLFWFGDGLGSVAVANVCGPFFDLCF